MLIYCSHKFGGSLENAKAAELKIKRLQLADPDNTYISPIHTFGFMYNVLNYEDGLRVAPYAGAWIEIFSFGKTLKYKK